MSLLVGAISGYILGVCCLSVFKSMKDDIRLKPTTNELIFIYSNIILGSAIGFYF